MVALLGCPLAAGGATLTLATYNVENYGPAGRVTDAGFRPGYPKPEAEKQALRRVIRALGADILALQEMGTVPYLEELQRDLAAEGLSYPHAALVQADDADRHVALLSKLPLKAIVRHTDLPIAYGGTAARVKRGLLEVTVGTSAGDLTLFVVHLKSRLTEEPVDPEGASRRAAEATAVRDCVRRKFPDGSQARYVILGDCNDNGDSRTLQHLERRGQAVVACPLPAADAHGEIWTEFYREGGAYAELDHILVSPALRGAVRAGKATIYDGPGVAEASDHRPVVATFQFGR
jgi:endonuclease/exonuclease/phosphatase family metal-dependent hydrolase